MAKPIIKFINERTASTPDERLIFDIVGHFLEGSAQLIKPYVVNDKVNGDDLLSILSNIFACLLVNMTSFFKEIKDVESLKVVINVISECALEEALEVFNIKVEGTIQ